MSVIKFKLLIDNLHFRAFCMRPYRRQTFIENITHYFIVTVNNPVIQGRVTYVNYTCLAAKWPPIMTRLFGWKWLGGSGSRK